MRLTDDYLILSDKKDIVTKIIEELFKCAKDNNFEFNKKKLRANFKYKSFTLDDNNSSFRWIGKIIDLNKMEAHHTQILDKDEAFYTVNVNFPNEVDLIPDFLKGKLKTFLLN